MAKTSSTRNMDICVIDENKMINTSRKRTPSAIVATTQKKAKSKKNLSSKYSFLWLEFYALNHINKQKELLMDSGKTTRELLKKKINFDEVKEIQSARSSFPYVPKKNGRLRGKMGRKGNTITSPNSPLT